MSISADWVRGPLTERAEQSLLKNCSAASWQLRRNTKSGQFFYPRAFLFTTHYWSAPRQRLAKRKARKEKLVKYVNYPNPPLPIRAAHALANAKKLPAPSA